MGETVPIALQWAKWYLSLGQSPIPLPYRCKVPERGFGWTEFQERQPTMEELIRWFGNGTPMNMALVTGARSGIIVFDVDKPTDALSQFVDPSVVTPRSKTSRGEHLFFRHPRDGHRYSNQQGRCIIPGVDIRGDGGMIIVPPSVHPTGVPYRWMTLPGGPPKGVNFAPLPDAFRNAVLLSGGGEGALIGSDINATGINPRDGGVTQRDKRDIVLTEGNRDESLYHLAACLKRGGMGLADAKQILEIAAKSCNPPFPLQQALAKADAVYSEEGLPADRNLSQLIRDWVRDNPGTWNVTSLDNDMSRMSRSEKTNRRKVLSRLVAEGVIERVPGQPRLYRTVNTELQTIDWVNADVSNVYPIRFPFQLESLCTIYPKNIIVIAGSYNGGKSAFCYNIVRKNMNHLPVRLISSEVSPEELKLRLSQFSEVSLHEWQQAEFLERSRDFAQVVRPDALNIIDYLEVGGDEFSRVGDRIKEIWEKLTTGVCVISLQKKKDVGDVQYDHGRGGELSAEKARLYLKIDNNVLKIVKAKNWANSLVNPNGRHFGFKLVGGCNFIEQFDEE